MDEQITARIAEDLGLTALPVEDQKKLIGQFGEVALKAATIAVVSKLSEDKRAEFAKLAEAGEPEALGAFLDREVPEHETIAKDAVAEEVAKFKAFQKP
jgi:Protein of unknown function (DUF5663)